MKGLILISLDPLQSQEVAYTLTEPRYSVFDMIRDVVKHLNISKRDLDNENIAKKLYVKVTLARRTNQWIIKTYLRK